MVVYRGNNWAKSTGIWKYGNYTSSQLCFISPFRSYQLQVQDPMRINKCKRILEKSYSKECKTNLDYRKVKCEANRCDNWAQLTKCASCISSR